MNQWAGRWSILDQVTDLVVSDYFVPVILSLTVFSLWFLGKDIASRDANQRAVLVALLAVGFSNLAVLIINQFIFRDRPFVDHELTVLFYQPTDSSLPANPAAVAFAMAAGVWQVTRSLGLGLYLLAALWGTSRVFVGVFYPSDVLVGAAIGVGMVYWFAFLMRNIEPLPTLVLGIARRFHLA